MPGTELTTMVMVQDPQTGQVLVQERVKSWKGLSFPGGHFEPGESAYDCAVRELKEETGLDITNLQACGLMHWCHSKTSERYMVFCYKTTAFSGTLVTEMEEGRHCWMDLDSLWQRENISNDFEKYVPIFLGDHYTEAFGLWCEEENWEIIYQ